MSSAPLFLDTNDFQLTQIENQGEKKIILTTQIPGLSLLLFYSPRCKYSNQILPVFKRLPQSITNCQFGLINVSNNRQLVQMSNQSITPIQYVPYIILYLHGQPYMIYNGPHNQQDIRSFVIEIATKLSTKDREKFHQEDEEDISKGIRREIPEYSWGQPLYGKMDVTYLTEEFAYTK